MPVADPLVEAAEVLVLVPQRLPRVAAALGDPLGQLNHLEDRLLAVQPHDVVVGQPPEIGVGLVALAGQHLDEHRHHDFRPTLADQRQGAVEIEQDVADFRTGAEARSELDKAEEGLAIFSGRQGHCAAFSPPQSFSSGTPMPLSTPAAMMASPSGFMWTPSPVSQLPFSPAGFCLGP